MHGYEVVVEGEKDNRHKAEHAERNTCAAVFENKIQRACKKYSEREKWNSDADKKMAIEWQCANDDKYYFVCTMEDWREEIGIERMICPVSRGFVGAKHCQKVTTNRQ